MYFLSCIGDHDDEAGRTKGYVELRWGVHLKNIPHWFTTREGEEILSTFHGWCPCKIAVVHHCYPPFLDCIHWVKKAEVLAQFTSFLSNFKRFVTHYGTELECKDRIMKGYGLPVDALPLAYDQNNEALHFHTTYVVKWVTEQHRIEQAKKDTVRTNSPSETLDALQRMLLTPDIEADYRDDEHASSQQNRESMISESLFTESDWANDSFVKSIRESEGMATRIDHFGVQKTDVLMVQGMNSALRIHPGNIRFRKLVEDHYTTYSTYLKKSQKTKLSEGIVRKVAAWGGRFMKWVPEQDAWVEVDFIQARAKVALTFRDITKTIKRKAKANGIKNS